MDWKQKLNSGLANVKEKIKEEVRKEKERKQLEGIRAMERKGIYNQAYAAAEETELKRKAQRDAKAKYRTPSTFPPTSKFGASPFSAMTFNPNPMGSMLYGPSSPKPKVKKHHKKASYKLIRVKY